MTIFEGIVLGLVQGLTEFLPISSTGHLIIAREFLGLGVEGGLAVDASLHLATALAVVVYFFRDIRSLVIGLLKGERSSYVYTGALLVGTVPAVIAGVLFNDYIETSVRHIAFVAVGLIVGSLIMLIAERFSGGNKPHTLIGGLWVGLFQALALFPGMSRSGMTISAGLMFGISREEAARFAFLLSFPVIVGAGALKFKELIDSGAAVATPYPLVAAALTALISALVAIHFLMRYLKTRTLMPFVWYRLALAGVLLLFVFVL